MVSNVSFPYPFPLLVTIDLSYLKAIDGHEAGLPLDVSWPSHAYSGTDQRRNDFDIHVNLCLSFSLFLL